ncbi:MAG TPA: formate--phosphoribosylaminoimidazolecarboxamide ligase family protein [Thermoplasmata archaeon]|nr:formate--phosphoribosylaminoimidazolecarboxamide ligase family protein [Thermoplasmata archaeon]
MPASREEVQRLASAYPDPPTIAAVGSHSAIDICDGAVTEGFPTLVLAQQGREQTYARYYRTVRDSHGERVRGCVDTVWTVPKFAEIASAAFQERLRSHHVLLVPNRALSSYVPLDAIENSLAVPILGSRRLLRIEERTERENYYALLERAGVPTPRPFASPDAIDGLAIVKLPHAQRRLERGFFTVASPKEFAEKSAQLLRTGVIRAEDLATARIERYILGPVFNFNFFYSPLTPRDQGLELLGVDERRESSLDGLVRLPAAQQLALPPGAQTPEYTVVGHGSLTVRESLLEEVFALGEKFVDATQRDYPPGMLGAFCLQTCISPEGSPVVFDVAARLGGGTNIHLGLGHPYGNALWRTPMSSGRRIALEVRRALDQGRLAEVVT